MKKNDKVAKESVRVPDTTREPVLNERPKSKPMTEDEVKAGFRQWLQDGLLKFEAETGIIVSRISITRRRKFSSQHGEMISWLIETDL